MKNIIPFKYNVTKLERSNLLKQKPCLIWLTGLSASGKSTIASSLETILIDLGFSTYILDGDNVRKGLNKDLSFSDDDRIENIRRIGEVSSLMVDAGLIVISAFISPFENDRKMVREMFGKDEFFEVFVDAPLELCEKRDPKGIYKKARMGEIKYFTGIDSPYQIPTNPDIHIKTDLLSPDDAAKKIIIFLEKNNIVRSKK
jgi:adenylylsulfate kinase